MVGSSAFNRTYRSLAIAGADVNNTGTDHNTFSNFVFMGVKGIKAGRICGSTDLSEVGPDKQFTNVAKAHTDLDPFLVKAMGLPFDFDNLVSKPFSPSASFDVHQHLTYSSVINTILTAFGSKAEISIENLSVTAMPLTKLLA